MPGLLRTDANCPKCHTPLVAMVRTWHPEGSATVEYFHQKGWNGRTRISSKARRKTRCKVFYPNSRDVPNLDRKVA